MGFGRDIGKYLLRNAVDSIFAQANGVEKQEKDMRDVAGDYGEEFTKKLISHENFGGQFDCLCVKDRRVPNLKGKGKREIDFIVLTQKKLHVIEVKNWAGRIYGKPGDRQWRFESRNGSGRREKNIVLDNENKAKVLVHFLNHLGFDISFDQVDHRVFFINTRRKDGSIRLAMDKELMDCPHVVTTDKMDYYLEVEQADNTTDYSSEEFALATMIDEILRHLIGWEAINQAFPILDERIGGQRHDDLFDTLYRLPTWDQLTFFGGKTMRGDIMGHYSNDDLRYLFSTDPNFNVHSIYTIENDIVEREAETLNEKLFEFGKSLLIGGMLLKVYCQGEIVFPAQRGDPNFSFDFRPAGSPDDITVNIMDVVKVVYGNRFADLNWLYNHV